MAALVGAARFAAAFLVVSRAAGWVSFPAPPPTMVGQGLRPPLLVCLDCREVTDVTVSVKQACAPTPFDYAWASAQFAGWPSEPAFYAVCYMKTTGMSDREIELAFLDCRRRLQ